MWILFIYLFLPLCGTEHFVSAITTRNNKAYVCTVMCVCDSLVVLSYIEKLNIKSSSKHIFFKCSSSSTGWGQFLYLNI